MEKSTKATDQAPARKVAKKNLSKPRSFRPAGAMRNLSAGTKKKEA